MSKKPVSKPVPIIFTKHPFEISYGNYDHKCRMSKGNLFAHTAEELLVCERKTDDWPWADLTYFNQEIGLQDLIMIAQWEKHRPLDWTVEQHLDNPNVNFPVLGPADERFLDYVSKRVAVFFRHAQQMVSKGEAVFDSESDYTVL